MIDWDTINEYFDNLEENARVSDISEADYEEAIAFFENLSDEMWEHT